MTKGYVLQKFKNYSPLISKYYYIRDNYQGDVYNISNIHNILHIYIYNILHIEYTVYIQCIADRQYIINAILYR